MELQLGHIDLRSEFQDDGEKPLQGTWQASYGKLKANVRAAVRAVGQGLFIGSAGDTHELIYSPTWLKTEEPSEFPENWSRIKVVLTDLDSANSFSLSDAAAKMCVSATMVMPDDDHPDTYALLLSPQQDYEPEQGWEDSFLDWLESVSRTSVEFSQ